MGFGSEVIFLMVLGLLVLGPKRLHAMVGQVLRAKAKFEAASRGFTSQLESELSAGHADSRADGSRDSVVDR